MRRVHYEEDSRDPVLTRTHGLCLHQIKVVFSFTFAKLSFDSVSESCMSLTSLARKLCFFFSELRRSAKRFAGKCDLELIKIPPVLSVAVNFIPCHNRRIDGCSFSFFLATVRYSFRAILRYVRGFLFPTPGSQSSSMIRSVCSLASFKRSRSVGYLMSWGATDASRISVPCRFGSSDEDAPESGWSPPLLLALFGSFVFSASRTLSQSHPRESDLQGAPSGCCYPVYNKIYGFINKQSMSNYIYFNGLWLFKEAPIKIIFQLLFAAQLITI